MKLSVGKRILMFFHWLLSLLIVAAFAVYLIVPDFLMQYYDKLEAAVGYSYVKVIGIALLAVYALLAIAQLCLIFKRRKRSERGFITVDSSDSGRVRIAISAIEQMVRQSVGNIDGITEMKIGIDSQDDAIVIRVNAAIVNGSHVPTITMNMQRAIRQFVETNCGVAVRTVAISINSVTSQQDASRRRRRGKTQESAQPVMPVPADNGEAEKRDAAEPARTTYIAPEPVQPSVQAPVYEPQPEPVYYEPSVEPQPANEPAVPVFDQDKPYESDFAKDLAAMKARDSEESGDWDDEGEPLDEDAE